MLIVSALMAVLGPSTSRLQASQGALRSAVATSQRRYNNNKSHTSGSIFDKNEQAWDHVFQGVETSTSSLIASKSPPRNTHTRRQAMTAREASVFEDMFNVIFDAVKDSKETQVNRTLSSGAGVGRSRTPGIDELAYRLRQQHKQIKWTSEADEELDRKREEMDLCDTDQQLLDWAMREVFAESQRYEEAARNASKVSSDEPAPLSLQPLSYPHLIAKLMQTFRDRYTDPYLALAIFDYAKNLSIASYVFGCTTPAYNELIETRWRCLRDLRGVCDALEEMRTNGVEMDTRTRGLAEAVRREVGERNLWEEETSVGSGEVWDMLQQIERLTAREGRRDVQKRGKKWSRDSEVWQSQALQNGTKDGWEFGQWGDESTQSAALLNG